MRHSVCWSPSKNSANIWYLKNGLYSISSKMIFHLTLVNSQLLTQKVRIYKISISYVKTWSGRLAITPSQEFLNTSVLLDWGIIISSSRKFHRDKTSYWVCQYISYCKQPQIMFPHHHRNYPTPQWSRMCKICGHHFPCFFILTSEPQTINLCPGQHSTHSCTISTFITTSFQEQMFKY